MNLDKADKAFSQFIRQKDADDQGLVYCYTCGWRGHWKESECGHYIPRANLTTRLAEMNGKVQCVLCNEFLSGNVEEYRRHLVQDYGEKDVIDLEILGKESCRLMQHEIDSIEQYYKDKIKKL